MIVFQSRKNYVSLENNIVTKKFKSVRAMEKEKANLEILREKSVAVSQVLGSDGDELYMKNIEGRTFCELSNELSLDNMTALVKWLDNFYNSMGFSRGDVNLRNFIYNDKEKTCFSVDFEDNFEEINIAMDYARILAFLSTYDPIFSDNKILPCSFLIEKLRLEGIDLAMVHQEYSTELSQMEKRRKVTFAGETVDNFWRKIMNYDKR